jgi:hypothetical protein
MSRHPTNARGGGWHRDGPRGRAGPVRHCPSRGNREQTRLGMIGWQFDDHEELLGQINLLLSYMNGLHGQLGLPAAMSRDGPVAGMGIPERRLAGAISSVLRS